jgi:Zn-dependent peptidase ImmA (M78 family)
MMHSVAFIRERARQLLKEFGIKGPPVPVKDLVAGHVLTLEMVLREEGYDGELVPELRLIRLNSQKPSVRQRFTLAHELGHWVLFHAERSLDDSEWQPEGDDEPVSVTTISKRRDGESNIFAAELLMPTAWVRTDWKTCGRSVPKLAVRYDVSEEAMWYRVMELRLIKQ